MVNKLYDALTVYQKKIKNFPSEYEFSNLKPEAIVDLVNQALANNKASLTAEGIKKRASKQEAIRNAIPARIMTLIAHHNLQFTNPFDMIAFNDQELQTKLTQEERAVKVQMAATKLESEKKEKPSININPSTNLFDEPMQGNSADAKLTASPRNNALRRKEGVQDLSSEPKRSPKMAELYELMKSNVDHDNSKALKANIVNYIKNSITEADLKENSQNSKPGESILEFVVKNRLGTKITKAIIDKTERDTFTQAQKDQAMVDVKKNRQDEKSANKTRVGLMTYAGGIAGLAASVALGPEVIPVVAGAAGLAAAATSSNREKNVKAMLKAYDVTKGTLKAVKQVEPIIIQDPKLEAKFDQAPKEQQEKVTDLARDIISLSSSLKVILPSSKNHARKIALIKKINGLSAGELTIPVKGKDGKFTSILELAAENAVGSKVMKAIIAKEPLSFSAEQMNSALIKGQIARKTEKLHNQRNVLESIVIDTGIGAAAGLGVGAGIGAAVGVATGAAMRRTAAKRTNNILKSMKKNSKVDASGIITSITASGKKTSPNKGR